MLRALNIRDESARSIWAMPLCDLGQGGIYQNRSPFAGFFGILGSSEGGAGLRNVQPGQHQEKSLQMHLF